MRNHKTLSILLLVSASSALTATGCSVKKQLNEMHDATVKLANDSPTQDSTNELKNLALKGGSAELRMKKLEEMDRATEMRGKLSAATAFYYGFEYQSWKAAFGGTPQLKSAMLLRMVDEFFNTIGEYRDRNDDVGATSKNNKREGLYALAAAMHRIDSDNERTAEEFFRTDRESVYSLIVETLINDRDRYENGEIQDRDMPLWKLRILQNEALALLVLKVRANFLFASPLATIASMDKDRGIRFLGIDLTGIADFFSGAWRKVIGGLDPAYANVSRAELRYECLKMEKALETRNALVQMGETLELDQDVFDIYSNMRKEEIKMERKSADYFSKNMTAAKYAEVQRMRNLIDQWLNFDQK